MGLLRVKTPFQNCKRSSELLCLSKDLNLNVWVAGIVAAKQRPGSASGVVFITLEDEEGHINCIVWPKLVERFRNVILQSRLLKIRGSIQENKGVIHIVANELQDASLWLGKLIPSSRHFH